MSYSKIKKANAKNKERGFSAREAKQFSRQITMLNKELFLAVTIRTLYEVYGWRTKRIKDFLESYVALMDEVADKRITVPEAVKACEERTGFNPKTILEDLFGGDNQ